jgi:hypothetical protein
MADVGDGTAVAVPGADGGTITPVGTPVGDGPGPLHAPKRTVSDRTGPTRRERVAVIR